MRQRDRLYVDQSQEANDLKTMDLGRQVLATFLVHRAESAYSFAQSSALPRAEWTDVAIDLASWLTKDNCRQRNGEGDGISRAEQKLRQQTEGQLCSALPIFDGIPSSVAKHACHVVFAGDDDTQRTQCEGAVRAAFHDVQRRFCGAKDRGNATSGKLVVSNVGFGSSQDDNSLFSPRAIGLVLVVAVVVALLLAMFGVYRMWGKTTKLIDVGTPGQKSSSGELSDVFQNSRKYF